jgi:hypothetical protein
MKTCRIENCHNFVFAKDLCAYHQYIRRMKGGDLYKLKKPAKAPNKVSKKRKEEQKYYAQNCKELTAEIRAQNNGKIYCFFSGKEITGFVSYHHLKKRIGDFYIDKEWLVPVINERHLEYHYQPIEWLLQQGWYQGFLARLKDKSIELYNKEIKKGEKSIKLNPKLFDDDEDLY